MERVVPEVADEVERVAVEEELEPVERVTLWLPEEVERVTLWLPVERVAVEEEPVERVTLWLPDERVAVEEDPVERVVAVPLERV